MLAPQKTNSNKNENKQFESVKLGKYRAHCYAIIDLGSRMTAFQNDTPKLTHQMRLQFETIDEMREDGSPYVIVTPPMTFSMWEKSKLARMIDMWFDNEAYEGLASSEEFDLAKLFDTPCEVKTVLGKDGNVYFGSVSRVKDMDNIGKRVNPTKELMLNPVEFDKHVFATLGEKTRNMIMMTPEWQKLTDEQKKPVDKVAEVFNKDTEQATVDVFKQAEEAITEEKSFEDIAF